MIQIDLWSWSRFAISSQYVIVCYNCYKVKQAEVRRKLELQTKEVDVNEAGEWLETVVQVQEMALGRANTKENPEQEKP